MDVLILLDKLDDLIYNSRSIPLTDQVRVERTDAFGLLDEIRAAMPGEIRRAREMVKGDDGAATAASPESPELRAIANSLEDIKRSQQRPAPPPLTAAAAEKVRSIVEAAETSAKEVREDAEGEARKIIVEAERASREQRKRSAAEASLKLKRAEEGTKALLADSARAHAEIDELLERLRSPADQLGGALSGGATALHADFERMRALVADIGDSESPSEALPSSGEDEPKPTSGPTEEWDSLTQRVVGGYEADAGLPGPGDQVEAEHIGERHEQPGEQIAAQDHDERADR